MKVLFSSYTYPPAIGGIETVSMILAREFARAGHQVTIVTETPGRSADQDIPIARRPAPSTLLALIRTHDVVFQNNICLRHLLLALTARRPITVLHQTWLRGDDSRHHWNDRLKLLLCRKVKNFAISHAISAQLPSPAEVVGNPYDDETFKAIDVVRKSRSILFAGRLVSDKGVPDLIQALKLLVDRKKPATLTIAGFGPEEGTLRELTDRLGLGDAVEFVGAQEPAALARLMNGHEIVAIPSRWHEPFGVVALEAVACGCVVVGSENGGLKDAIGKCGLNYPNGNMVALADCLQQLLNDSAICEQFRRAAPAHLARFKPRAISDKLLKGISR